MEAHDPDNCFTVFAKNAENFNSSLADDVELTRAEHRKMLRRAGYEPTPIIGKRPVLAGWQKQFRCSDAEIEAWEKKFPDATNTGLVTATMPTLDVDLWNENACRAVENLVRGRYANRGQVLDRVGNRPKFAIPFRTVVPFRKIVVKLISPDGSNKDEKIEILCDGQQVAAFGNHPDTHRRYRWNDGAPGDVAFEQLPPIIEDEAQRLVKEIVDLLVSDFGYQRESERPRNDTNTGLDADKLPQGGDDIRSRERKSSPHLPNVFSNHKLGVHRARIEAALNSIPSDDYQIWLEIGSALFKELAEDGFDLFETWSAKSTKYNPKECRKKWRDFSQITAYNAGTIFHHADKAKLGWSEDPSARKGGVVISATQFTWIDPHKIPRREWAYRPYYIRKFSSLTVSPGGVGKSSLLIAEALSMVSGKPSLGVTPEELLRVWYWNGEDPLDELQRRIAAACKYLGVTKDDIGDRLFVDSGRNMPIVIAENDKTGACIDVPTMQGMIETIITNKIDVVIIDPFIASHRVPENDNTGIELVAKAFSKIADETNCAVMLSHHTRKTGGNDVTTEDGRGASALLAAVRAARALNPMTKEEARNAGIDEGDRRQYVRADNGKANMARPAKSADWFRLESVELGNSGLGMIGGDNVGVAAPWSYPAIASFTRDDALRAWEAVRTGGPWRANVQSSKESWVGVCIAEALGLDLRYPQNKSSVRNLIVDGLKQGWLKQVEKHDKTRKKRSYIEVGEKPAPRDD